MIDFFMNYVWGPLVLIMVIAMGVMLWWDMHTPKRPDGKYNG